jgi:hypothetical protein
LVQRLAARRISLAADAASGPLLAPLLDTFCERHNPRADTTGILANVRRSFAQNLWEPMGVEEPNLPRQQIGESHHLEPFALASLLFS